MPNYLVKKISKSGEIIYMQYKLDGYEFKPKNLAKASVSLEKITIVKPSIIDQVLTQKIDNKIKKIIRLVMYILNTEDDTTNPSDVMLALNEISRLRSIILNKYQDYISKDKEGLFLKKLRILENELRIKNLSYEEIYNSYGGPKK